jgi:glycosyltransferase involved in cell wall biosynthesis
MTSGTPQAGPGDGRPLRVCFLSTYAYPLFRPRPGLPLAGGAEVQFHYLARELAKDPQFDVSVVTGDFGQPAVEQCGRVTLLRGYTPRDGDGPALRLRQAAGTWRILGRADADVYLTTATTAGILLVSLFCRLRGRKHAHRTAHEREAGALHSAPGLGPWLYRRGFRMTDLILTQNEDHRAMLRRNAGADAVVLRNGFPARERPAEAAKTHVLWMARCLPWKGPERFLDLAERLPAARFVMVAPGCGGREGASVARRAAGLANLTLIEEVPFAETQALFDKALLFVNTSQQEGFPNTFLQAGLGAAPIVSLQVDPDGFLSRHGCGRVCGGSLDELVRTVERLLADPAERSRLGAAAFDCVRRHHDLAAAAATLKDLLRRLAGRQE